MSEQHGSKKSPWHAAFAHTREYVRRMKVWKKRSRLASRKIGPGKPRL